MPPRPGCPRRGPPSPEVTEAFCRVPSTSFSQAPRYSLPIHLCRFRVRSITVGLFPGTASLPPNPIRRDNLRDPSPPPGPGMLTWFPSTTAFALALGAGSPCSGLALLRNPWIFGVSVSHTHLATHVSIRTSDTSSHDPSQGPFVGLRNAPLPRRRITSLHPQLRCMALAPVHLRRRTAIRPVSCYAFFKGWLLLSQPPGCFGLPTSFPT